MLKTRLLYSFLLATIALGCVVPIANHNSSAFDDGSKDIVAGKCYAKCDGVEGYIEILCQDQITKQMTGAIQQALIDIGEYPNVKVTSIWDDATKSALKAYLIKKNMPITPLRNEILASLGLYDYII